MPRLARRAIATASSRVKRTLPSPRTGSIASGRSAASVTFVRGDAAIAAKAIATFRKEHDVLEFKGGTMDGEAVSIEDLQALARLPGRDALNAQLAGVVASPLTGLVRGLGALISGLAIQLKQIEEQGLVSGEAPAEEAPPAEGEGEAAEGEGEAAEVEESPETGAPEPEEAPVSDETDAPQEEAPAADEPAPDTSEDDSEAPSEDEDADKENE